jgi:hypothetical protein
VRKWKGEGFWVSNGIGHWNGAGKAKVSINVQKFQGFEQHKNTHY